MGKKTLTKVLPLILAAVLAVSGHWVMGVEAASPKALKNSSLFYGEAVQGPLAKGVEAIELAHGDQSKETERLKIQFTFAFYDRVDAWMRRNADPENGTYDAVELQIFLYNWVAETVTSPRFALARDKSLNEDAFEAYARKDAGLPPSEDNPQSRQ